MPLFVLFAVSNIVVARFMAGKRWRVAAIVHAVMSVVLTAILILLYHTDLLRGLLDVQDRDVLRRALKLALSVDYVGQLSPVLVLETVFVFNSHSVGNKVYLNNSKISLNTDNTIEHGDNGESNSMIVNGI